MNPILKKLEKISSQKERRIIGLMSGTSMDGLDIALCRFRGSGTATDFELEEFTSVGYPEDVNHQLIAFATADCIDPQLLCVWHTWLAHLHAGYIKVALKNWKAEAADVDLVASHGQTIYHAPRHKHNLEGMPHATLQIGDGDHIAHQTGIITISDFRQRDTARGNEGAPLAAYGDYLLFSDPEKHRIMLNIGGISNFTWLPAGSDTFPPMSFDTGPGNTLIDAATREHFTGLRYDKGGGLAARGNVHSGLIDLLKQHPYFGKPAPKTTGFEVFHLKWVEECMADLKLRMQGDVPGAGREESQSFRDESRGQSDPGKSDHPEPSDSVESSDSVEYNDKATANVDSGNKATNKRKSLRAVDLLATLTRLTEETIADQIHAILPDGEPAEVYVSGGGAHNDTLIKGLEDRLGSVPVTNISKLGVSADAKEALFFAALANELVCGEDTRLHLGKISLPDQ